MYLANNQRLSFFSILFLLLYFIKEILSLGIRTDNLAHVRLIVPGSQGQANASANVYPCFYDITYQRGR